MINFFISENPGSTAVIPVVIVLLIVAVIGAAFMFVYKKGEKTPKHCFGNELFFGLSVSRKCV